MLKNLTINVLNKYIKYHELKLGKVFYKNVKIAE